MKLLPLKCNKDGVFPFNQLLCTREKPQVLLADTKMGTQWSKREENFSNLDLQQRDISFRVLGNNKGSLWLGLGAWCCIENDFGTLRRAWIDTLSEAAVNMIQSEDSHTSKGASCFLKPKGLEEKKKWGWKGRLKWHVGSPGVSLCVIGEWCVFICRERESKRILYVDFNETSVITYYCTYG